MQIIKAIDTKSRLNLTEAELCSEINRLKKEKNAVILAHFYQEPAIQDIADFVGDSLKLSQQAAETEAEVIVFAGVHFMAETSKIINPEKKVLLPDLKASCSLAESCEPKDFKKFVEAHPNHIVITYINCSAEIKALSDIVCTSSNAEKIINAVPKDKPIIFAPDKNLGQYMIQKTGRDLLLWNGTCMVHEAFNIDKILDLHNEYPNAKFIAHPESSPQILKVASYIGSTSGLINFVKTDTASEYIIATEAGILHQMQREVPQKILIPAPIAENNSCACSECGYMKMNTLEKLYLCLKNESPEIQVSKDVIEKAINPINRMLALSN
ncbi:MAG: quinolinate synthase NadA [Flavobacteriaceae bacterium]